MKPHRRKRKDYPLPQLNHSGECADARSGCDVNVFRYINSCCRVRRLRAWLVLERGEMPATAGLHTERTGVLDPKFSGKRLPVLHGGRLLSAGIYNSERPLQTIRRPLKLHNKKERCCHQGGDQAHRQNDGDCFSDASHDFHQRLTGVNKLLLTFELRPSGGSD